MREVNVSNNVEDFSNLKTDDLVKLLFDSGANLSEDQKKSIKQQIAKKKSRSTLSLKPKVAVAPEVVVDKPVEKKVIKQDESKPVAKKVEVKPKKVVSKVVELSKKEKAEALGDKFAYQAIKKKHTSSTQKFAAPSEPVIKEVKISEWSTVSDLASQMAVKSSVLLGKLMNMGVIATINKSLDQDTAILLVEDMGHKAILVKSEEEQLLEISQANDHPKEKRPPVVTVMGHVDHGKTTLLDAIRKTQVVDSEQGGITQHIGAYSVQTETGSVTFIDTPGHEAFTAMRARGAKSTDMVVLVVAADDGVMPQTIEAIQHAKAASVPIVVAINKIDKEGADVDKIKGELAQHEVVAESWGGDVLFQEVSAKHGTGIEDLLENLSLQSEILELKAPKAGLASGIIIESVLDKGLGPVATLLVQSGCLRKGNIILIGSEYGKVRSMLDSNLNPIDSAEPSTPVKVTGLSGVPAAGDSFLVMESEKVARDYAAHIKVKQRDKKILEAQNKSLEQMFKDASESSESLTLNVVLKSDTHGSAEALAESVKKLSSQQIAVKVVASSVGRINETDVNLAYASNALLVGFNVRADSAANKVIQQKKLDVFYCGVIYDLIEKINALVKGLEAPVFVDEIIGLVDVREVFRSSKFGVIAGSMVLDGVVKRNANVRVLRDGVVIHTGTVASVRRLKDDVAEVKSGTECGVGIKDYSDIKEKDQLEIFVKKEQK